ncbi:MAG: hypothetical protein ACI4K9_08470 [Candidatus Fimenecus sp.]
MLSEKEQQKYIKAVARKISCSKKDKAACMAAFADAVEDVVCQEGDITPARLQQILGDPSTVAKELEATLDVEVVRRYKRKRVLMVVLAVALVLALLIGLYFFLVYCAVQPIYVANRNAVSAHANMISNFKECYL